MNQTTIKQRIHCEGIGLHSGKPVSLCIRPAAENTGIIFHLHTAEGPKVITASPEVVIATGLATTLGTKDAKVSTVEHLLAALRGLDIDNVHIEVSGEEIPILDGSAAFFAEEILKAGIIRQGKSRRVFRFSAPFALHQGDKYIKVEPYNGFRVNYTIDFPHPIIGRQQRTLELTPASFSEIANARTFGFIKDVEALKANNLALGGSLDNAIVLDEMGVMNKEGLRHPDEFVRHKILDFVGDMAMLPLPLQGSFTVFCSGHALNNDFLRRAMESGILRVEYATPQKAHTNDKERRLSAPSFPIPAFAG